MIGLCLCGGGIKAAAHIGALKALEEENIKFDCVSGASSGSIIATMYALGYNSDEMWKMFKEYCNKIKYVEWKNMFKIIFGLIFKRKIIVDGLNSGKVVEKIIDKICLEKGVDNINEIKMPLLISMVDLQKGTVYIASSKNVRINLLDNTEYITDMPIGTAVRASCSFPMVFSPCEYKELQLIDGGTRENLPWKELKYIGAEKVVGISFENISKNKKCCSNIIDVAARAMELQGRELSYYEKSGIDNLIKIELEKVSLLDSSKANELYKIGYNQTKKQIKELKKICE
ncbi:MAG: hypothetical protein HFJ55_00400 [Clostridia bacterium]|nr:hypothetical protein [Clostridia bacterium]